MLIIRGNILWYLLLPDRSLLLCFLILRPLRSIVVFFVRACRGGRIRLLSLRILLVAPLRLRTIANVDHLILINVDVDLNQDRLI